MGWGLCLPPRTQPPFMSRLSWAPLYICPVGFCHVPVMGEGDQGQQKEALTWLRSAVTDEPEAWTPLNPGESDSGGKAEETRGAGPGSG